MVLLPKKPSYGEDWVNSILNYDKITNILKSKMLLPHLFSAFMWRNEIKGHLSFFRPQLIKDTEKRLRDWRVDAEAKECLIPLQKIQDLRTPWRLTLAPNSSARGSDTLFWTPQAPGKHMGHVTNMHAKHSSTQNKTN